MGHSKISVAESSLNRADFAVLDARRVGSVVASEKNPTALGGDK